MTLRKAAAFLAAFALTVGLIGAGVGASYSDSATAQQNVSVGTFGIEVASTVPGAVVSPDKHSVTFAAPMIVSSAASGVQFPFTVKSTGSVPVNITISQTLPLAPFTSLLMSPVTNVLLGQGETHEYLGGLQWPMLVNADLAKVTGITYTAAATEGGATIIAVAPTVVPQGAGLANGGITIPSVVDLTYFINGTQAAAGFNQRSLGTYAVTAVAAAGHLLTGYPSGGWSLTVADAANVRPITISQATTYSWNGSGSKAAGAAPVVDNVAHTVTYVVPVNTAATPTAAGIIYNGPAPVIGNYTYVTTGTTVIVRATATVSSGLTSQANLFRLVYRNGVTGINFVNVPGGTLNVPGPGVNQVTLSSRHQGGANGLFTDNMPGVMWSGVAGTGSVTIVLTFSATTP